MTAEAAGQLGHGRTAVFLHLAERLVGRCHDQILQHLNIIRIHHFFR